MLMVELRRYRQRLLALPQRNLAADLLEFLRGNYLSARRAGLIVKVQVGQ
jgi:hypothetical protein